MKRVVLLCITALALICCTQREIVPQTETGDYPLFSAGIKDINPDTKTYVDDHLNLHWTADDRLSIFAGNTYNQQYKFIGSTGDNNGDFEPIETGGFHSGSDIPTNYAVYPYNPNTSVSYQGEISLIIPETQEFAWNSFGLGANTMVAATKNKSDNYLAFNNVCGFLVVRLYGDATIKRLTIYGNNSEKLSGPGVVTVSYGQTPSLTMKNEANGSISIDCGDGVTLNRTAEKTTEFWFCIPPTTFSKGFTIVANDGKGGVFIKETTSSRTVTRNTVNKMALLECQMEQMSIEAVDLGLPSGTKWASCNLGATNPEEHGGYYAWGELFPKSEYSWKTYLWCEGDEQSLTKYNTNPSNGLVDHKIILDLEDDAAHMMLGGNWRTPVQEEFDELLSNCDTERVQINGVNGYKISGTKAGYTDKWIFLPEYPCIPNDLSRVSNYNVFLSASLRSSNTEFSAASIYPWSLSIPRYAGCQIRPVYCDATVSEISLDKTSITILEGTSDVISATISPSNVLDRSIIWSSSNDAVATVNARGEITAIKAGTATITAESADSGIKAYCTVTVKDINSSPTLVFTDYVAPIYTGMNVQGLCWDQNRSGRFHYISECGGDLMIVQGRRSDWVDGGAHQQMHAHTYGPAYAVFNSAWNFNFQQIGLINTSIDRFTDMLNNGGASFLQDYIYELRAVRAFYYLQLINEFGRIPIVTTSKMSVSNVNQSNRSEVYAWLRDELIYILPHLSPKNSVLTSSGEYYGRMTQPVVYMMLAKLAINAAVWSQDTWNDGRFTGGIDKVAPGVTAAGKEQKITLDGATCNAWETVIYIQEKLNSLGYDLQPSIMENFLIGNQDVSKENIFVRPNDPVTYRLSLSLINDSLHSNHTAAIKNLRGSNGPSLTKTGALLFGCKEAKESENWSECDYSEVDPRFKEFFYYDRIIENGKQVNISAGYSNILVYKPLAVKLEWGSPVSGSKEEYDMWTAGARVYKIRIDAARDQFYWSYDYTDADMVYYRYADLLLLSAEAHYRMGDTQKALDLVNQVRNRVKATPRTSIDLKTILDERGLELVWEPTRREDLIRYGMYTEPTADRYPGVVVANGVGEWKYDAEGYTTVCPIPTPVLQLNANFTQNPGY